MSSNEESILLISEPQKNSPLLGEEELYSNEPNNPSSGSVEYYAFSYFGDLVDGSAKTYAAMGLVFMTYSSGSLYIMVPLLGGSVLQIGDRALKQLAEKHPQSETLQRLISRENLERLSSGFSYANEAGLGFLSDFGFAWSTMQSAGILITGKNIADDKTLNAFFMLGSSFIAALTRSVQYKEEKNIEVGMAMKTAAKFLQGATAPSGLSGLLALQQYISTFQSLMMNTAGSMIGLVTGLTEKSYECASFSLKIMMKVLLENPSLAAMVFSYPLNIEASVNLENTGEPTVTSWSYYGMVGFSCMYWGIKSIVDTKNFFENRYSNNGAQMNQNRLSDEEMRIPSYDTNSEEDEVKEINHQDEILPSNIEGDEGSIAFVLVLDNEKQEEEISIEQKPTSFFSQQNGFYQASPLLFHSKSASEIEKISTKKEDEEDNTKSGYQSF